MPCCELADAEGRRGAGLPAAELARAVAPEGETTLERLAAADSRLIVVRPERGVIHYALSHDRMAEVVARIVEEEGRHGALDVDPKLLRLHRRTRARPGLAVGCPPRARRPEPIEV